MALYATCLPPIDWRLCADSNGVLLVAAIGCVGLMLAFQSARHDERMLVVLRSQKVQTEAWLDVCCTTVCARAREQLREREGEKREREDERE
jgi:hypothetical protein